MSEPRTSATFRSIAVFAAFLIFSVILTYPPDWAVEPGTRVPLDIDLPFDAQQNAWARFVQRTAERYPQVLHWEIWNEPDMDIYWGGSVEDYFHLLKAGYLAVKAANPDARVIAAGLAYWPDPGFFDHCARPDR